MTQEPNIPKIWVSRDDLRPYSRTWIYRLRADQLYQLKAFPIMTAMGSSATARTYRAIYAADGVVARHLLLPEIRETRARI